MSIIEYPPPGDYPAPGGKFDLARALSRGAAPVVPGRADGPLDATGDRYLGDRSIWLAAALRRRYPALGIRALYSGDPPVLEHAVAYDPDTGLAHDARGTFASVGEAFSGFGATGDLTTEDNPAVAAGDDPDIDAYVDRHWGRAEDGDGRFGLLVPDYGPDPAEADALLRGEHRKRRSRVLDEARALQEAIWNEKLHPRWPPGAHDHKGHNIAGQWMRVGQRFDLGGHEWEIAHVAGDKIIANEASGDVQKAETRVFDTKTVVDHETGQTVEHALEGAKQSKPRKLTSGGPAQEGDAYINDADKHMYVRIGKGSQAYWQDAGIREATDLPAGATFKGHIAKKSELPGSGTEGKWTATKQANSVVVDAVSHPETHDPSISLHPDSKLTPEQWDKFGRVDQIYYNALMDHFGPWQLKGDEFYNAKPGGKPPPLTSNRYPWKKLRDQVYQQANIEFGSTDASTLVEQAFGKQYGSSTGETLSMTGVFRSVVTGNVASLLKARTRYERAKEVESELNAIVAWDLMNRLHAPDVSTSHMSSDNEAFGPVIQGKEAVLSALSNSWLPWHWGEPHLFGMAVPVRHITLATDLIGGSCHSENEFAMADRLKVSPQTAVMLASHEVSQHGKLATRIKKMMQGGAAGDIMKLVAKHMDKEDPYQLEMPPTTNPNLQLVHAAHAITYHLPPTSFIKQVEAALTANPGHAATEEQVPVSTLNLKPGNIIEKNTPGYRYLVIEHKGLGSGQVQYIPLNQGMSDYDVNPPDGWKSGKAKVVVGDDGQPLYFEPPPRVSAGPVEYDVSANAPSGPSMKVGQMNVGDKIAVEGDHFQLTKKGAEKVTVKSLTTGDTYTVDADWATQKLHPTGQAVTFKPQVGKPATLADGRIVDVKAISDDGKDAQVYWAGAEMTASVPVQNLHAAPQLPKLIPQKGDTFSKDGKKYTITNVQKNGIVSARPFVPGGGPQKVEKFDPQDLPDDLFRPDDYEAGPKQKLGQFAPGTLINHSSGKKIEPYMVLGTTGGKTHLKNLGTGEVQHLSQNRSYPVLVGKSAGGHPHDQWKPGDKVNTDDFQIGDKITSATNVNFTVKGESTQQGKVGWALQDDAGNESWIEKDFTSKGGPQFTYQGKGEPTPSPAPSVAMTPNDSGSPLADLGLVKGDKFMFGDHIWTVDTTTSGGNLSAQAEDGTSKAFHAFAVPTHYQKAPPPEPSLAPISSPHTLPDAQEAGDLLPFSTSGTVTKPNVMLNTLPKDAEFSDLMANQWKVKQAGEHPIITNGTDLYKAKGTLYVAPAPVTATPLDDKTPDLPVPPSGPSAAGDYAPVAVNKYSHTFGVLKLNPGDKFMKDGHTWVVDSSGAGTVTAHADDAALSKAFPWNQIPESVQRLKSNYTKPKIPPFLTPIGGAQSAQSLTAGDFVDKLAVRADGTLVFRRPDYSTGLGEHWEEVGGHAVDIPDDEMLTPLDLADAPDLDAVQKTGEMQNIHTGVPAGQTFFVADSSYLMLGHGDKGATCMSLSNGKILDIPKGSATAVKQAELGSWKAPEVPDVGIPQAPETISPHPDEPPMGYVSTLPDGMVPNTTPIKDLPAGTVFAKPTPSSDPGDSYFVAKLTAPEDSLTPNLVPSHIWKPGAEAEVQTDKNGAELKPGDSVIWAGYGGYTYKGPWQGKEPGYAVVVPPNQPESAGFPVALDELEGPHSAPAPQTDMNGTALKPGDQVSWFDQPGFTYKGPMEDNPQGAYVHAPGADGPTVAILDALKKTRTGTGPEAEAAAAPGPGIHPAMSVVKGHHMKIKTDGKGAEYEVLQTPKPGDKTLKIMTIKNGKVYDWPHKNHNILITQAPPTPEPDQPQVPPTPAPKAVDVNGAKLEPGDPVLWYGDKGYTYVGPDPNDPSKMLLSDTYVSGHVSAPIDQITKASVTQNDANGEPLEAGDAVKVNGVAGFIYNGPHVTDPESGYVKSPQGYGAAEGLGIKLSKVEKDDGVEAPTAIAQTDQKGTELKPGDPVLNLGSQGYVYQGPDPKDPKVAVIHDEYTDSVKKVPVADLTQATEPQSPPAPPEPPSAPIPTEPLAVIGDLDVGDKYDIAGFGYEVVGKDAIHVTVKSQADGSEYTIPSDQDFAQTPTITYKAPAPEGANKAGNLGGPPTISEMPITPYLWANKGKGKKGYDSLADLKPGEQFTDKNGKKGTVVKHNATELGDPAATTTVQFQDGSQVDIPQKFVNAKGKTIPTRVSKLSTTVPVPQPKAVTPTPTPTPTLQPGVKVKWHGESGYTYVGPHPDDPSLALVSHEDDLPGSEPLTVGFDELESQAEVPKSPADLAAQHAANEFLEGAGHSESDIQDIHDAAAAKVQSDIYPTEWPTSTKWANAYSDAYEEKYGTDDATLNISNDFYGAIKAAPEVPEAPSPPPGTWGDAKVGDLIKTSSSSSTFKITADNGDSYEVTSLADGSTANMDKAWTFTGTVVGHQLPSAPASTVQLTPNTTGTNLSVLALGKGDKFAYKDHAWTITDTTGGVVTAARDDDPSWTQHFQQNFVPDKWGLASTPPATGPKTWAQLQLGDVFDLGQAQSWKVTADNGDTWEITPIGGGNVSTVMKSATATIPNVTGHEEVAPPASPALIDPNAEGPIAAGKFLLDQGVSPAKVTQFHNIAAAHKANNPDESWGDAYKAVAGHAATAYIDGDVLKNVVDAPTAPDIPEPQDEAHDAAIDAADDWLNSKASEGTRNWIHQKAVDYKQDHPGFSWGEAYQAASHEALPDLSPDQLNALLDHVDPKSTAQVGDVITGYQGMGPQKITYDLGSSWEVTADDGSVGEIPKSEVTSANVVKQPEPSPPPEPTAGVVPGIPDYTTITNGGGNLNIEGGAGGTTGAKIADLNGQKWLIKTYGGNENRVASELLANAIYREMGHSAAQAGVIDAPQGKQLAYPLVDGEIKQWSGKDKAKMKALGDGIMTDALVGNWDFAGLEDDNVLWNGDVPTRIDQGGTFFYRAQGKPKNFGPVPVEVKSLLSGQGQGVKGVSVSEAQMRQQAGKIADTLTPQRIDELVDAAPFADQKMKEQVRDNLKARVTWMAQFANGDHSDMIQGVKLAPGPAQPPTPQPPTPQPPTPPHPMPPDEVLEPTPTPTPPVAAPHIEDLPITPYLWPNKGKGKKPYHAIASLKVGVQFSDKSGAKFEVVSSEGGVTIAKPIDPPGDPIAIPQSCINAKGKVIPTRVSAI